MVNPELKQATDLLARLVALDSTSSVSNIPVANVISEFLGEMDARIERFAADDGSDKVNLGVWLGPDTSESRGGLVLSGHMDCVPAVEPEWTSDPFQLTSRDGRLHGRGSAGQ